MHPNEGGDVLDSLLDAHRRMREAYWEARDIDLVVEIAGEARGRAVDETSTETLGALKRIENDLASFTWPGWAEPGIAISSEQMALGLDAARRNLALAERLDRPILARSRAHWLLGAQLWAAGHLVSAADQFTDASVLAERAGQPGEALLAALYRARVTGTDAAGIVATLRSVDGGDDYIAQVSEAERVIASLRAAVEVSRQPPRPAP